MSSQAISESTRDRAIELVQRAYADGRIAEPELEHRLNLALLSTTATELRLALDGLPAPLPSIAPQERASSLSRTQPLAPHVSTDKLAPIAHASALFTGPIGPALGWIMSRGQGRTHHEITKALNFQILAAIVFPAVWILSFLGFKPLIGIWGVAWVLLTIVGAVKANRGEDWENPLTQVTGFRPITEQR